MRKLVVLSVALIAMLLVGSPAGAAQAGPGRAPAVGGTGHGTSGYVPPVTHDAGSVRVDFVGFLHSQKELPGGREFSLRALRDLLIVVEYRDLPAGPHTQQLRLFAPDGSLYQQFASEVENDAHQPVRGKDHRVRGHSRDWERVETRLPVGGTWITEHSLYGKWRLEIYLDNSQHATTSTTFVLHK